MFNIQATYDLTANDCAFLLMPLFHVHGLFGGLISSLKARGSVVIPLRF